MANAKKCDRCGKFYIIQPANSLDIITNGVTNLFMSNKEIVAEQRAQLLERVIDLCPNCSKSLKKWLMAEEIKDGKQ